MTWFKTNYRIIAAGMLFLAAGSLKPDVIWSDPPFPTENDNITVYLDPSLAERTPRLTPGDDVYTHTGVTTELGQWQNVIGDWGQNTVQPQLTYLQDSGTYKLVIGSVRDFYSVTDESEHIKEICFVFRNAAGTVQTEDLFLPVYEPGLSIILLEPDVRENANVFLPFDGEFSLSAFAQRDYADLQSFELRINGESITSTLSDTLDYIISGDSLAVGLNTVELSASTVNGLRDTMEFSLTRNPEFTDLPLPAGSRPGISFLENSTVLALFAPGKDFVYVLGDFNDWTPSPEYFMNKYQPSADSTVFWIELDDLQVDTDYAYQYLIDGDLQLADPYAELVLDPWNDQYISSAVYPDLKSYPSSGADGIVSVLNRRSDSFAWSDSLFTAPAEESLVIYELLIRDFIAAHDYKVLKDTLDYLENLGINAVELMPVNEFEGNESWGYNPAFYFAPDKYYGRADDLKRFVDEAHKRGIAVIFDMVLNHSYNQSPLVRLYNSGGYTAPTPDNPWYNVTSPNPVYNWGSDFNHESIHTKYFIDRVNEYWLEEFHADGFRFDFTKGFTNTSGDGWSMDASRIAILKRMADHIWSVSPEAYVILEHFAENSEESILSAYGMMIWGNTHWNYGQASMGYASESDFSWGYYKTRGWSSPHLVTYMESHDEERVMFKDLSWGNASGAYSVKDLYTALNRQKLTHAFFLTLPGPKMIWQFGELGYDFSIDYNGRVGNKPIRWDYLQQDARRSLYETISALNHLRFSMPAMTSASSNVTLNVASTLKTIDISGIGAAKIIGNFDVVPKSGSVTVSHPGTWYEYFSGEEVSVATDSKIYYTLPPGDFRIYTDNYIENPYPELLTSIENDAPGNADAFRLSAPFPNPFNPVTRLQLTLPAAESVTVSVIDITGRQVKQLLSGFLSAGEHTIEWDGTAESGRSLSSGVYLLRLKKEDGTALTRKMLLLK